MNMISQEQINEIRSNVDIIDIISSYIPLTPKGKNYFGVCPFHDDHAPSMSVSKDKQIYTCFSCGATGNVFKFIMDYEHVSFPESVNIVASKAGLDFHLNTNSKPVVNKEMYEIYDIASKLYQNNLNTTSGKDAKEYLHSRDIDDYVIKEFGIGLSSIKRDYLTTILRSKKINDSDLIKSGIVTSNEHGIQDIYYNRIMFPIWDVSGQVVGFSGRVYNGETNYKYINTKETEIFKKGELLYNYHRSKEEARKEDTIIIMEGQLDVIRAYSIGVKNVIGTMGTAITHKHALLVKRLARNVILCFDGDDAGAKATMSCTRELEQVGIIPKVVRLENKMDPDDYIRKNGKKEFLSKINNPMNVMDFKLSYYKKNKDFTNTMDVSNYIKDMINELKVIDDEILKELTLKKISEESNLNYEFLKEQLAKEEKKVTSDVISAKEIKIESPKIYNKYQKAEINLIYYMLKSEEVIRMYDNKITYMPTSEYRILAREISYFYKTYGMINIADFMSFLTSHEEMNEVLGPIINMTLKEKYTVEEIDDYIKTIRDYSVEAEYKRLKGLMQKETDSYKKALIASKIVALKVEEDKYDK